MADFVMPALGADMQAGELITWLKKPGDTIQKGEIIAEVETDKAVVEVESLYSGVVETLLVEPGTTVPVGAVLAVIRADSAEELPPAPTPVAAPPPPSRRPATAAPATAPSAAAGRLRVSPVAQKLAQERGLDLSNVTGSGPGGRIMQRDVEEAVARLAAAPPAAAPPPEPATDDRALRMRQSIAAAMSRSHREIPHFYVESVIDLTRASVWLSEENIRRPVAQRLIYGVLLIKAAALALKRTPQLNGVWNVDHLEVNPNIHVGVAISLPGGGLVSPAIHHTDQLPLTDLMTQFRNLVARARAGRLRSSELSDPTITVTSLGEQGAESVYGLINPPQVALVGFGRLTQRPWVVDGRIEARRVIHATVAGDHRAVDGYRASVYLAEIERLLQEPKTL
ncbi:MAG TPA: dihydrolipoamide acetyltransferase family protein [Dehalococcoidia bacterium]|nr:dihydrolipoamide acetyltransferase family protein [Dehalococcoidia bacterium]